MCDLDDTQLSLLFDTAQRTGVISAESVACGESRVIKYAMAVICALARLHSHEAQSESRRSSASGTTGFEASTAQEFAGGVPMDKLANFYCNSFCSLQNDELYIVAKHGYSGHIRHSNRQLLKTVLDTAMDAGQCVQEYLQGTGLAQGTRTSAVSVELAPSVTVLPALATLAGCGLT